MFENIRVWLNQFKIPSAIFLAKYGLWPRTDLDLLIVVGKGIDIPKIENADHEIVDKYSEIYIKALNDLFERYKGRFGIKKELEIL